MKKCRRIVSLLLACVMLAVCGAAAFADETSGLTLKYPKPGSWFTMGDEDLGEYYNIAIKVPCKGTVTISAEIDEDLVSGETAQTTCPQQYCLKKVKTESSVYWNGYVKNGTFFTKTVSAGEYSFYTVFPDGKYKWTFTPAATAVTSVKNASTKSVTVKWKKIAGVTGYQIQYSLKSSFSSAKTVTVAKASAVSKKITGLTKGKRYYVRVRTYCTINGKKCCSKWSAKKSVKVTK